MLLTFPVALLLVLSASEPVVAFATGEKATTVVGQSSFTTKTAGGGTTGLNIPKDVALDSSHNLWVVDSGNNRILEFPATVKTGEAATMVIGQPDFGTFNFGVNSSRVNNPANMAFDSAGNLWVADRGNNRVLEFPAPLKTDEVATVVIGQPSFTSNTPGSDAATMWNPVGVAFDPSGNLWVSDFFNSRVLEFTPPFSIGEAATNVIGQTTLTGAGASTTQNGLNEPYGITFDSSGNLWVADYSNNRVMEFTTPLSTGENALLVIGQSTFTGSLPATTQRGLMGPIGVAVGPSGNLWVADQANNRLVQFMKPFSTGEAAAHVLGQISFTTNTIATTQTGLSSPYGLAVGPSGNVWVAEYGNNRVMLFPAGLSTSTKVSCSPSSVATGVPSTCTATVTDTGGGVAATPTGTVAFTSNLNGTFSFTSCTLSGSGGTASCSVTFTPVAAGTATIVGKYSGSSAFGKSMGSFKLTAT